MSATFGRDEEAQWVLIYGHGTSAMTHCSRNAETHTLNIHQQGQPSINFTSPNCQEGEEQSRGQVLHTKYSASLIRLAEWSGGIMYL